MRDSKQIEQLYYDKLRQMTGEERLKLGFAMSDFAMNLAKTTIQNQFPNISEDEQKEKTTKMFDIIAENQKWIDKMMLLCLWQKIQKS